MNEQINNTTIVLCMQYLVGLDIVCMIPKVGVGSRCTYVTAQYFIGCSGVVL